jgi:hypothetical protein
MALGLWPFYSHVGRDITQCPNQTTQEHSRSPSSTGTPFGHNLVRLIQRFSVHNITTRSGDGRENTHDGVDCRHGYELDVGCRRAAAVSGKVANVDTCMSERSFEGGETYSV